MPSLSAPKLPKILMFFGADRVGKSTLIASIEKILVDDGKKVKIAHFSGPKPHHHSPIEQYTEVLDPLFKEGFYDFILCDRCGSEVVFYDSWRRRVNTSNQWALSFESYIISQAETARIFLVEKDWEEVEQYHIQEILDQTGKNCSQFYINMELETRRKEHYAYYDYMQKYLRNTTTLCSFNLKPDANKFIDPQAVLSYY